MEASRPWTGSVSHTRAGCTWRGECLIREGLSQEPGPEGSDCMSLRAPGFPCLSAWDVALEPRHPLGSTRGSGKRNVQKLLPRQHLKAGSSLEVLRDRRLSGWPRPRPRGAQTAEMSLVLRTQVLRDKWAHCSQATVSSLSLGPGFPVCKTWRLTDVGCEWQPQPLVVTVTGVAFSWRCMFFP